LYSEGKNVKRKMKTLWIREGTEKNQDRNKMEVFYYKAIYDVLQGTAQQAQKIRMLKKLKTKLICLNNKHRQKMMVDIGDQDRMKGENPSLHQIIKARKRQNRRMIQQITDEQGMTHTTTMAIIQDFAKHFCNKFQPIQIDEDSARQLLNCDLKEVTNETNTSLEQPITMNELWIAIAKGKQHKAAGHDGIGLEFYKGAWEIIKTELLQIVNRMRSEGMKMERQLQVLIVCIPKHPHPTGFDDYRPLTLMNTDYKIMTRVIATRLKPHLTEILNQNQFCGVQETQSSKQSPRYVMRLLMRK